MQLTSSATTAVILMMFQTENCYHLKFARKSMLLLGIWPITTQGPKKLLYETYFWITFVYYILFNISGVILAVLTWTDNYLITATSMAIVIEYVSNAYKVLLFKSQTFKYLLREIATREKQIFNSNSTEFKKIYTRNTAENKKIVLFYTIMGTTGISLYFITPLVSNVLIPLGLNNATGVQNHHFIIFSWFPFDPNRYYAAAYLLQFTGCLLGYSYIVHCGAFYISVLSFITAQLKILQHVFIHFSNYTKNVKHTFGICEEQAQFVLLRLLIQDHVKIINFVQRTNKSIKLYTLINFVVSSFQLSLVAYQIFKLPPLQQVPVLSYFITLSTQLFLTYRAAHAISIESENLAASIFKGDWHSYSPKTLRTLRMVCMRAQKPLAMTLHSFANVQVNSLFKIFKALYSYMCLILKT